MYSKKQTVDYFLLFTLFQKRGRKRSSSESTPSPKKKYKKRGRKQKEKEKEKVGLFSLKIFLIDLYSLKYGHSWLTSYGSWTRFYSALFDKVCLSSLGNSVSSNNKTECHYITEF